jgi:hypothetical protein
VTREFIIYEDSVHVQVFLVQAESEEQAWKLYLDREYNCIEQPDGTYRSRPGDYDNLNSVFGAYGIIVHDDGSYSNTHGAVFPSLKEVKDKYGIEELPDETFIVHDVSYPSLMEAVRGEVGHHHVEIDPCDINMLAAFQTLFVSKDKWDYVELDTPEDLKSDIISQHLWQAERYSTLGQTKDVIAELRKALRLTFDPREEMRLHAKIAWHLSSLCQLSAAAKHYKQALRPATEFDNRGQYRIRLAENYEKAGHLSKAIWHYERVINGDPEDDPDADEREDLKKRVAELKRSLVKISATKP